jgi:hypothetical protein
MRCQSGNHARKLGAQMLRGWHQSGVSDIEAYTQRIPLPQIIASETSSRIAPDQTKKRCRIAFG